MISWAAINRIVERAFTTDAKYRQQAAGRPLRLDAEALSDEELLAKLRAFGIELDQAALGRLCDQALSAEEIVGPWLASRTFKTQREALEGDWIWIGLVALWQRWFPDTPSFETLDDTIQAGYDRKAAGDLMAACRLWLDAWADVLRLLDKADIRSIEAFDTRFQGTQCLFNWVQDLEMELWNAGLEDRAFLTARISVCEESLRRFGTQRDFLTENWRRALAESYFELGETGQAEALYQEWLEADPKWGWGWIDWSDCYRFGHPELRDLTRSEHLLRKGLSVVEVRDREDLAERLADLYEEQGRMEEAREIRRQARGRPAIQHTRESRPGDSTLRQEASVPLGDEKGRSLSERPNANVGDLLQVSSRQATAGRQKVGRNDPCPCGSGKKFKRCCGG